MSITTKCSNCKKMIIKADGKCWHCGTIISANDKQKQTWGKILISAVALLIIKDMIVGGVSSNVDPALHEQHEILEQAKQSLRDPDSASFRNTRVYHYAGHNPTVCGQIQAKNGYGGWTGWQYFVAADGVITVLDNPPAEVRKNEIMPAWWCANK